MKQSTSRWIPLSPATVRMMGFEQMARGAGARKKRRPPVKWAMIVVARLRPGT